MGRHKATLDETALAQIFAPDGVGRHENIGRLGLVIVLRRTEKPETLVGNFQITGTGLRNLHQWPFALWLPVGLVPVGIIPVGIIPVRRIFIRPTVVFETTHTSIITEKRELNCSELEN